LDSISRSIKRFDFDEKITGTARYCADVTYDGMLYAKTLRSTKARARILSVDAPPLPDGYWIVDANDIPGRNVVPIVYGDQPFFARDAVNYIGEPILLVVGPDKQIIVDLLDRIKVTYEDVQPVLTIAEAEQVRENFIFGDKPYFVAYEYAKGDPSEAAGLAVMVFEDEFETGYQEHAYLETQGIIAVFKDARVTVSGAMQCPYYIKEALIQALGWPEERVRVIQVPTGGGFGGKEEYPSLPAVHAALAAIKSGKPVQLVFDRHEDILCTTKRHPSVIRLKSYVDAKNRIIGREIDIKTDAGAYAGLSGVVLQRMMLAANGVYDVPHLKVTGRAYATNTVVSGAVRGFGGPQAFFAVEMHMDTIARALNLDAFEFKRQHFLHKGDTSSTGGLLRYDIKLDEIAAEIDRISGYHRKRRVPPREKQDTMRGIGCSFFFHGCGFTGSGEEKLIKTRARLKKYPDNSVQIFVSNTEIGQGALTALRKIVAQALEVPIETVRHTYPDTDDCPDSGPTVASRTTLIVGKVLFDAALEMKKRWHEEEFEIVRAYEYPRNFHWDNERFQGNAYPAYSWGANVVEVDVDPATYEVTVTGVWAVYDIGTPIDETMVRGQIEGGIAQGLAYGGMEVLTSKNGALQQTSLTDYTIPTALDFPRIESRLIENPCADGPFGARGVGELTLIGAAPALALAVQDAVGRKVTRLPVTPENILEIMDRVD
jgi:CO/xanthine dehydrogenase Mo-binding subunit